MADGYLIHFARPYRHARHYLGYSENVHNRMWEHRAGRGSRLMAVIKAAGIGWALVRTWPNIDRARERRLKRMGGGARHCPICRAERKAAKRLEAAA